MRILLLMLAATFSLNCLAQGCTYDQANQQLVLENLAGNYSGGVLDRQGRAITWAADNAKATTLQYGGCDHLSFVVSKQYESPSPLTQNQIFAIARELSTEFWDFLEAGLLEEALSSNAFVLQSFDEVAIYNLSTEFYAELSIRHDPLQKTVTIAWMRNF